jgi:long-chain fatty acid transport protein
MKRFLLASLAVVSGVFFTSGSEVQAQSLGVELHNQLMPASGGMGGVSISRPQDLTSALNANPATLTQFGGTQFLFGGAWAEPTFNIRQTTSLPTIGPTLVDPYAAKSGAPGSVLGNIGLTQDISELGIPATLGIGFLSSAGGVVDFRQQPESNGTNTGLTVFAMPVMVGVQLTERLSVGGGGSLGIGLFDGPFIGVGGLTTAYALRGTAGFNYQLTDVTSVGAYYQSKQSFQYENAITLPVGPSNPLDVNLDLPRNVGLGVANNALCDGRLLVGVDLLYKLWDQADLFNAIYDNQLAVQLGTQWTQNRYRLRAGYVWAENPLDPNPGPNLGGVIQSGGLPSVRYSQALLAITSEHRLSFGLGITDVLPGIDADLMGGGMFKDTEQLGPFTQTSIESYWLGFGLTWRFSRGSCEHKVPCRWSTGSSTTSLAHSDL